MNTRKANLRKLRLPNTQSSTTRNGSRNVTQAISRFFTPEPYAMECSEPLPSPIYHSEPLSACQINACEQEDTKEADPIKTLSPSKVKLDHELESSSTPSPKEKQDIQVNCKPIRAVRTKLATFLPKEKRMKSAQSPKKKDDFETPDKNIKTAPKTKAKPRAKKQQNIKSAFLKNEQLFSEVTAQHCIADNVNPDEMQMALALSMSEADACCQPAVENKETDDIRDKLKKYGFHVAEPEDYNIMAYVPSKRKVKWANKFTPLTLRNPKRQTEKVNQRVEEFLRTQFLQNKPMIEEKVGDYSPTSKILLPLIALEKIVRPDTSERTELVEFYVLTLFEPSKTKAGHLLKDVSKIPGRDFSPVKSKCLNKSELVNVIDPSLQSPAIKKSRLGENAADDCVVGGSTSVHMNRRKTPTSHHLEIGTFPDTYPANASINNLNCDFDGIESSIELCSAEATLHLNESIAKSLSNEIYTTCDLLPTISTTSDDAILLKPIRATSPDIFADSDVEMETEIATEKIDMNKSSPGGCNITTYEIYSSDEVKTFSGTGTNTNHVNNNQLSAVIHLTQQESDISSQNSDKILQSVTSIKPQQFSDYFPNDTLTLSVQSNEDPSINIKGFKKIENEINFNANSSFEKGTVNDLPNETLIFSPQNNEEHTTSIKAFKKMESEFNFNIINSFEKSSCNDLPNETLIFSSPLNEEPSTSKYALKEIENEINFSFDKSSENKSLCFTFGSSTSEDFLRTNSLNKSGATDKSIDLTQNSDDESDCILLSDDEVNYSILKTENELQVKREHNSMIIGELLNVNAKSEDRHEFSFLDFVTATQPNDNLEFELKPSTSFDSLDLETSKPSDFGILKEQSPFKTPTKTPKKTPKKSPKIGSANCRRALSESFIASPVESLAVRKRFSSVNKFIEFTKSDDDSSLSDLDDIDKLIYGSPSKKLYKKPTGLDQLLTGPISTTIIDSPIKSPEKPKEFEFNGRLYLVRTVDVTKKPNYEEMSESALLDQLYRYGIRKLKRKQAVKILEYVYNQTHPYLVDEANLSSQSLSTDKNNLSNSFTEESNDELKILPPSASSKFNLKDCWGHILVSDSATPMEIDDEKYITQTNNSKKISTALLPFHIAWYNLVRSNKQLHEAILHYEPIDLQEVYLFFKGIGYRYDPKELKSFFDSRSIIFRYDLNKSDPSAGANRHIRKKGPKCRKPKKS